MSEVRSVGNWDFEVKRPENSGSVVHVTKAYLNAGNGQYDLMKAIKRVTELFSSRCAWMAQLSGAIAFTSVPRMYTTVLDLIAPSAGLSERKWIVYRMGDMLHKGFDMLAMFAYSASFFNLFNAYNPLYWGKTMSAVADAAELLVHPNDLFSACRALQDSAVQKDAELGSAVLARRNWALLKTGKTIADLAPLALSVFFSGMLGTTVCLSAPAIAVIGTISGLASSVLGTGAYYAKEYSPQFASQIAPKAVAV